MKIANSTILVTRTRRAALPTGWLSLGAAPTFAVMALFTGLAGGGPADLLCAAASHGAALGGMVPMYLLMSAFHLAPWLKLISRPRRGA